MAPRSRASGEAPRLGKQPPRHRFFLNPYPDIRFTTCPQCGDIGWAYRNGRNDQAGMICQLGCGYAWAATARRFPAKCD